MHRYFIHTNSNGTFYIKECNGKTQHVAHLKDGVKYFVDEDFQLDKIFNDLPVRSSTKEIFETAKQASEEYCKRQILNQKKQ